MKKHTTKTPKLGPIARALLVDVAAAQDARTLYRLDSKTWADALDDGMTKAEIDHVLAAIVARRDALAPPVKDARRATLEGFAALLLAEDDGNAPTEEGLSALVAWYAAGCGPGGPGLDSHPYAAEEGQYIPAEPPAAPALPTPLRLAHDSATERALALMDRAYAATTLDELNTIARLPGIPDMDDDLKGEIMAAIDRNIDRVQDATGRAALARILAAPDGFALMAEVREFDANTLTRHWRNRYNFASDERFKALTPATVAEMIRRAETAPDLGALRRVHQDALCLELDSEALPPIFSAVEGARVRLTPTDDDAAAARRRAVEGFAAVVSAEIAAGAIPTPDDLAEMVGWYIPACRAGGPGLLVHAGSYGESAHFVPAEAAPADRGAQ